MKIEDISLGDTVYVATFENGSFGVTQIQVKGILVNEGGGVVCEHGNGEGQYLAESVYRTRIEAVIYLRTKCDEFLFALRRKLLGD